MNAKRFFFGRFKLLPVALYLAVVLAGGVAAVACSTPVYRYAMYGWSPAPYTVFYFHKDEPGDADRELQAAATGQHRDEQHGHNQGEYQQEHADRRRLPLGNFPQIRRSIR